MASEVILVHYGEIGTKGENRELFERALMRNLGKALQEFGVRVYRRYGRVVCEIEQMDREAIIERLRRLPGIEYFAFARRTKSELNNIEKASLELLKEREFSTFKVETKRSNKAFPLTSLEINRKIGELVVRELGKKVNVKNPELKIHIEICEKESFIYLEKVRGIGGLPVGVSGKVICLLSGGIDSPVAAFLMMKRGCEVVFLHFYNSTLVSRAALSKVERIVKKLTEVQLESKLYVVPFDELQREIVANIPPEYRMIIYRRYMMRIANSIAGKEMAKAIVTGDSVGQVASQTLDNLASIFAVAEFPVLTPLAGMNKMETVKIAKQIGTYELSVLPYPDCCSFMIAKHPATKTKAEELSKLEEKISPESMEKCLKRIQTSKFSISS